MINLDRFNKGFEKSFSFAAILPLVKTSPPCTLNTNGRSLKYETIRIGIIGYVIWIVLYGFLLYYIFGVRKSEVPEYEECVRAAKLTVSDCIKIIECKELAEIVYSDPEFYIDKYNKLVGYYPNIANKTLRTLIYKKARQ